MDAIKPGLLLWDNGREPVRLLQCGGEVVMTSIWATTGAVASREAGANFSIVWHGRVIELDLFGIPKGSRNKDEAIDFIRFASSSQSLANMVGTSAQRADAAVVPGAALRGCAGATPRTIRHYEDEITILSDAEWWAENHAALEEAFDAWLAEAGRQGASGTVR